MIARRTLLEATVGSLAGGALLLPRLSYAAGDASVEVNEVNPKKPPFGAIGDFATDDTRALQAALDYCFGPPTAPHGTAGVAANGVLRIPPGRYKVSSPLQIAKLHG